MNQVDAETKKGIRRTTVILFIVAAAFFFGFILMGVLRA